MKLARIAFTTLAGAALAASSFAQSTYVIGGPSSSLSPSSGVLGWEGAEMAPYRAAVEDPNNFGPSGLHDVRVQTRTLSAVNDVSLAGVDAFVCSYWHDSEITPAQSDALIDFFLGGGDLIVIGDDFNHDAIADRLGIRILAGFNETTAEVAAPHSDGTFGINVTNTVPLTAPGYIDGPRVLSKNGRVGAVTPFQLAASGWWTKGDYGPNTGALIVLADPGLVTDGNYVAFDNLAKYALNMTEVLSNRTQVKVLGGPSSAIQSSGPLAWELGAFTGGVQRYLHRDDHFGRFGPGEVDVVLHYYDSITPGNLMLCDAFISPFWKDTDLTAQQRSTILSAHAGGMELIVWLSLQSQGSLLNDIGLSMNIGNATTGGANDPLENGPFGNVGTMGRDSQNVTLYSGDIYNNGGVVVAEDGNQEPVAAYFLGGVRPGINGNLLVVTDSTWLADDVANYGSLNDEAQFTLNAFHRVLTDRRMKVAGPADNLNSGTFSWTSQHFVDFRAALARSDYFGPQGYHHRGIEVIDLFSMNELTLATMDVVVTGQWDNEDYTTSDLALLMEYNERGGRLMLIGDDSGSDELIEAFGLMTDEEYETLSSGGSPCYVGPFGTASVVPLDDENLEFDEPSLLAMGGVVVGRNNVNEPTVVMLPDSAMAPGSGDVLIIGDVQMFINPDFDSLAVDTIFALNSMAYLAERRRAVPTAVAYGDGYPGAGGLVPTLKLEGSFLGNTQARLRIANAAGRAQVLMLFGTTGRISVPFQEIVLRVNFPWTLMWLNLGGAPGLPGAGIADLVGQVPPGVELLPNGFQLQALVLDPQAFGGIATSEGIEVNLNS